MISRFNDGSNVAYKRTSQGVFCSNCSENWGGEFSTGTMGNFHPALTHRDFVRAYHLFLADCILVVSEE